MAKISKSAYFNRIGYEPHSEAQWKYHKSKARFRLPCCGRRFGKSTMAGKDLQPKLLRPKAMYWIVGPTYDLGEKEFRVVWDDMIIRMGLGRDKRVKKAYNKRSGEMYIEFPWQTRLEVRSATHPESLVGEGLDGAIMSEAAKHREDTWQRFIRPALADKRGWADFPTTPEGTNWFYDIFMLGLNEAFPAYESWRFPSWANSKIYPGGRTDEEILLLEQTTAEEWFLQEIGADFSSFVGKIYGEFDEQVHVSSFEYNPNWPNYIAFDWGFTNPLAAVEFQVDPWDNIWIWRTHYKKFTSIQDHVELLKSREQPPGYRINMAFGDAADPEAAMYVTENLVPCRAEPEAKANWREGIDLVKTFLKVRQVGVLDEFGTPFEAPKLFISPNNKEIIREFNGYRSKPGTNGRNAAEIADKIDDHCLDALRYALVHLYVLGVNRHLDEVYTPDVMEQSFETRPSGLEVPVSHDADILVASTAGDSMFSQLESVVF
jgi:hypothetical protein